MLKERLKAAPRREQKDLTHIYMWCQALWE